VPRSIQYAVAIIIALMVYSLVLNLMLPSGDHRGRPRPEMTASEFMQAGLAHIAHEVKSMADDHIFLRSGEPLLPRPKNHRRSGTTFAGRSCNCNGGAYTFSEIEEVEAQLLNTEITNSKSWAKSIARVKQETTGGLENSAGSLIILITSSTTPLRCYLSSTLPFPVVYLLVLHPLTFILYSSHTIRSYTILRCTRPLSGPPRIGTRSTLRLAFTPYFRLRRLHNSSD
jgi:hypothetical protein